MAYLIIWIFGMDAASRLVDKLNERYDRRYK